jgi:hypothetical protein
MFWGPYGSTEAALQPLGLLSENATLNIGQTTRQKFDGQPRLLVVQAIQQQSAEIQAVIHEITKDNLKLALGLDTADLVDTAGVDVVVTNEQVVLDANGNGILTHPIKTGNVPVVTNVGGTVTYVAGTDYIFIPRDQFGRSVIYRLSTGAIPAQATLEVDYTYTPNVRTEFPVGQRTTIVERMFKVEEEYTDGRKLIALLYRANITVNGNITVNAGNDQGMSIPLKIDGLYDSTKNKIVSVFLEG